MRLLESEAAPERRGGGTMTSMVVHAAIIAGTVMATMRADAPGPRDVPIPPEIVYRAPLPQQPTSQPQPSTGGATGVAPGTVTILVPTTIPTGIPTIDMTVDVPAGPTTTVLLGGPATGATEGGFGSAGGGYGAPDASGAWDAHTVEVPVVPDARNPSPLYPEMLRTAGMTGRVVAEFVVDSTGRVRAGSLVIVESTHELFTSSVRRTVPSFRFTPARVQGHRVAQRVRVPFEFEVR